MKFLHPSYTGSALITRKFLTGLLIGLCAVASAGADTQGLVLDEDGIVIRFNAADLSDYDEMIGDFTGTLVGDCVINESDGSFALTTTGDGEVIQIDLITGLEDDTNPIFFAGAAGSDVALNQERFVYLSGADGFVTGAVFAHDLENPDVAVTGLAGFYSSTETCGNAIGNYVLAANPSLFLDIASVGGDGGLSLVVDNLLVHFDANTNLACHADQAPAGLIWGVVIGALNVTSFSVPDGVVAGMESFGNKGGAVCRV